jgi:hypothetical protein
VDAAWGRVAQSLLLWQSVRVDGDGRSALDVRLSLPSDTVIVAADYVDGESQELWRSIAVSTDGGVLPSATQLKPGTRARRSRSWFPRPRDCSWQLAVT